MKTLTLTVAFLLLLISSLNAQTVSVHTYQQITTNIGGFNTILDQDDAFGVSMDTIGDLNNDGIMDIAVGACGDDDGGSNRGAVYILFLDTNKTVKSYSKISSTSGNLGCALANASQFGISVCGLGDLDNDGVSDIAVGAHCDPDGGSNTGAVRIIFMNSNGTVKSCQKISSLSGYGTGGLPLPSGKYFGIDVACIGDINNDSIPDLVVSSGDNGGGTNKGACWVLTLDTNGTVKTHYKIYDGVTNFNAPIDNDDGFGTSVCGIGDIDNDNIPDIAVGTFYDDDGGLNCGAVYIIKLNSNGSVKGYYKISNGNSGIPANGIAYYAHFGTDVKLTQDIDGNGIKDLLVGAYRYGSNKGATYIIGLNSNSTASVIKIINNSDIAGITSNCRFGTSVCHIGDINNDGKIEIAAGASKYNNVRGEIFVISLNIPYSSSINATHNLCNGLCNGVAIANAIGGIPPYTYLWSNNSTNDTISNLCAGTYTVTITDALSNTTNSNVTITQPPPLTVTASGNTNICAGSCSNISATGSGGSPPLFYMWSNGLGLGQSKQVCPTATTTYTVNSLDLNGCYSSPDTIIVNIIQPPTVSFSGLSASYCANSSSVTLTGTPTGGTFSGNGISGSTFNPSVAGSGTHNITYTYSNGICANTDTQSVIVNQLPTVSFTGLASVYCENITSVTLTGNPAGGTFSGNGISGNIFNPVAAGIGTHNITYTYSNGICTNSNTQSTIYNPISSVSFSGLGASYCQNASAVSLSGTPTGGTFSGNGISGNIFNPATAGSGTHNILYTYSNGNCTKSDTQSVIVNPLPTVSFSGLSPVYCQNASSSVLTGVPGGGTFSGNGISGNIFNPVAAGVGTHNIIYTYSNGICTNTDTQSVIYNPILTIGFSGLNPAYCQNASAATLIGVPSGGTYSGNGISGNTFNPATAGTGNHTIIYTYTNGVCTNADTQNVVVNPLPTVSFSGLDTAYCNNAIAANLIGSPTGGTFSGNGISANIFSPSSVSPGYYLIVYSYTDANGCSNSQSKNTHINSVPTVSASGNTNICAGSCTNLSATGAGGTPPIFYMWSNGLGLGQSKQVCPSATTTYTVNALDLNGCSSLPDTIIVNVTQLPLVSFSGLNPNYCINTAAATLTGSPAGGTFSGTGISGNTFNPFTAGTGTHNIIYTYSSGLCSNADTQSVVVNSLPTVSFTGLDTAYCKDAAPTTLIGTPSGGTFNGNGISGNIFSPSTLNTGYYPIVYSYTDANGCSNSQTQNTHIKSTPIANAGTNVSITYNSNATLFGSATAGSGFYSYNWAPADSLIFANVQNPTTVNLKSTNVFTLTVTDLMTGCQGTAQVIVTVTGGPLSGFVIVTPNTICAGDNSQLNAYASGGSGNYSYLWSSNPGSFTSTLANPVVAPTVTTTYTVTISSGSSTSIATSVLTVNPKPVVNITGLLNSYCINSQLVNISGSPVGGMFMGNGIYGFTFNPSVAGAGTHQIIYSYTSPFGCFNSDTQTVVVHALPVVNIIGLAQSYCTNSSSDTLIGTPSGGTFTGTGIIGNTFNPSIAGTGYFNITYSYTDANGCSNFISKSTVVISSPIANAGPDKSIPCGSVGVMIGSGATSGFSYSWLPASGLNYPNSANPVASPNITTVYSLTITNNSTGCSATDNVTVSVTGGPTAMVSADTIVCSGSPVNLSASGGLNYLWSTGDSLANISVYPTTTTNYSATVTDLSGCSDADTVTVTIFPESVINLGNDTTIKMSNTITLDAGAGFSSYHWNTGSTTQTHLVDGTTLGAGTFTFYVDAIDVNLCSASDTIVISIIDDTGLDLKNPNSDISIYPNPSDGQLFVKLNNKSETDVLITIVNLQGKLIFSSRIKPDSNSPYKIQLTDYAVGLYFITVQSENFVRNEKLMIY